MRLSLERNFLFVEVPKTASTSVSDVLKPHALALHRTQFRRFTSNLPFRENPARLYIRKHDPAYWMRTKLGGDLFGSLFKFGFVRNPFDRLVSAFEFGKQHEGRASAAGTFSDFLEFARRHHTRYGRDQTYFLADPAGRLLVDKVYRFETLQADLEDVLSRLHIAGELPHRLKTRRRHYSEYYSARDIERVKDVVARDLEYFGYRFEG